MAEKRRYSRAGFGSTAALFWLLAGCSDIQELKVPTYETPIAEAETKTSAFEKEFPLEYRSYRKNDEDTVMTEYKGSVPFNKNDNVHPLPEGYKYAQPYLKNLFLGYPFSYEYRETRGHTYAIEDILRIDRINTYGEKAGLPATCWNCKTTRMPGWLKAYGDGFWHKDFNEFRTAVDVKDETIGCATCHDPKTMTLRITSAPLNDYLEKKGIDWRKSSRNEMRYQVCAQCHVEYYFADKKFAAEKKPIFPWLKGLSPEEMYAYYQDQGSTAEKGFEGAFVDWIHPVSKTPMLKAQHPEFETFISGPHGAANVACADCHMAYTRSEDRKKISSHWWTSPLKDVERSCRSCHSDKTAEYLKERVLLTQKKVFDQLLVAEELSVKAHEAVRRAMEYAGPRPADAEALLIGARQKIRKGQFFWDLVSAENSVGFHNPVRSLDALATSQQLSQRAVDLAIRSTDYAIAKDLAGDIKEIVPPILYHSRKLQQDPAHLDSHPWLRLLPLLPRAEKLWDGQKRLPDKAAGSPKQP